MESAKLTQSQRLLKSFLDYSGFTSDIIESYDDFLNVRIPARLRTPFFADERGSYYFTNVRYRIPTRGDVVIDKELAKRDDLTYTVEMSADLVVSDGETTRRLLRDVVFGQIPLMVGSSMDPSRNNRCDDTDGYFIVNGSEYTVVLQQQLRYQTMIVAVGKAPAHTLEGTIKCVTTEGTTNVKLTITRDQIVSVLLDNVKSRQDDTSSPLVPINVFHAFNILDPVAFRTSSDTEAFILDHTPVDHRVAVRSFLTKSRNQPMNVSSYMGGGGLRELAAFRALVRRQIFPHIDDLRSKAIVLAVSLVRYSQVSVGIKDPDDRDSWAHSQVTTPGMTLSNFFNSIYSRMMNRVVDAIQNKSTVENSVETIISSERSSGSQVLTTQMISGFVNHNLSYQANKDTNNSTQELLRRTLLASKVHINRIIVRSQKKGKMMSKRMVHRDQVGYVCVTDTPEGASCGLTKNKAITCRITVQEDVESIKEELLRLGIIHDEKRPGEIPVLLDYNFIGYGDGQRVRAEAIRLRRQGIVPRRIAVILYDTHLEIQATGGRPVRPLLIVEDGRLVIEDLWEGELPPFAELLERGGVEFLDAAEQARGEVSRYLSDVQMVRSQKILISEFVDEFLKISRNVDYEIPVQLAMKKYNALDYTHCELDPTAILGISTSLIPFSAHNQGPRNTYQCNMGTQALGLYTANNYDRFDPETKFLAFPTRPIVETTMAPQLGLDKYPAGQSVMVAIMAWSGFNQEDAIVLNQSSVDAGVFATIIFKTISITLKGDTTGSYEKRGHPLDPRQGLERSKAKAESDDAYRNIGLDGLPFVGASIKPGDCVIGAIRTVVDATGEHKVDISEYANMDHKGVVERVIVGTNVAGNTVIKVKLRRFKSISVGDKIASRSAQKSTIGKIVPFDEMPYEKSTGTRPDLIMNPLGIISRMTIGQVLEMLSSTSSIITTGERINATNWGTFSLSECQRLLEDNGYDPNLNTTFVDPRTGKDLEAKVFMGPCYYQVLTQQSEYKIQARQMGMVDRSTRQAISGRTRGGGIKTGTMETNAFIAHGAVYTANERLCSASGVQDVVVCRRCGGSISNTGIPLGGAYRCSSCTDDASFVVCKVKPPAIYWQSVLAAAGIKVLMNTK